MNAEEIVAGLAEFTPDERKACLLEALEQAKQACLERERLKRERNDRQSEAVMVQRSLPQYPEKILRYETTIKRQMYRAISELERLQRARRAAGPETRGE